MKILVIDDHTLAISGLAVLLSDRAEMDAVSVRTTREGLIAFEQHRPDVSLLAIDLRERSGFDLVRQLKAIDPTARIIVLSMQDDPMLAVEALDCGAKGFVSQTGDPALIGEAIEAVADGRIWLSEGLAQEMALIRTAPADQARP